MKEDDVVKGVFYKDATDTVDILNIKLFVDGEQRINSNLTKPFPAQTEFRYPPIKAGP